MDNIISAITTVTWTGVTNVWYIKLGRLVLANASNVYIAGAVNLGLPTAAIPLFPVVARNDNTGAYTTLYVANGTEVNNYLAPNFQNGFYSFTFSYITI